MLSIRKCPKYWLESEPTISLNYKWAQFLTISEDSFASLELFSKDLPKVTKLELDPVLEEDWDVLVSYLQFCLQHLSDIEIVKKFSLCFSMK